MDEAQVAFQLNTGLFTVLKPPKAPLSLGTTNVALGIPLTPVEGSRSPSPLRVSEVPKSSSGFSFSSVLAFLIALAVSQLIIVFGGFSGEKGSAKLEAITSRLSSVFSV